MSHLSLIVCDWCLRKVEADGSSGYETHDGDDLCPPCQKVRERGIEQAKEICRAAGLAKKAT